MSINSPHHQNKTLCYRVSLRGCVSQRWLDWFGDVIVVADDHRKQPCTTTVRIRVVDQAALFGSLQTFHNLGFSLLEVRLLEEEPDDSVRVVR